MNSPPHKRNGPARGCSLSPSHDRSLVSIQDQEGTYSESGDTSTPADFADLPHEQQKALRSVAFWLKPKRLPFRSRWVAQPLPNGRPLVCYGNFPGEPAWRHKVWIWQPSGYLQDLGEPWMFNGADIAENVAKLIPGAAVLDCRREYAVAA